MPGWRAALGPAKRRVSDGDLHQQGDVPVGSRQRIGEPTRKMRPGRSPAAFCRNITIYFEPVVTFGHSTFRVDVFEPRLPVANSRPAPTTTTISAPTSTPRTPIPPLLPFPSAITFSSVAPMRSEERRVGKECR